VAAAVLPISSGTVRAQQAPESERQLILPGGRTDGLNGNYWKTALAGNTQLPVHERLMVVAPGGRVLDVVDGEDKRVALPVWLDAALNDEATRATLVHNHPSDVSLSCADLRQLARPGVERVIALGNDGSVFEATAGSHFGTELLDESSCRSLLASVTTRLLNEVEPVAGQTFPVTQYVPHLLSSVLHRLQVIDYRVTPSVQVRVDLNRYQWPFDRVVAVTASRQEKPKR
jgi:hypothetical protein